MADLQLFDDDYLIKPNGFINIGALCYSNSILQCLLSCTSLIKTLHLNRHKDTIAKNTLAQALLALYDTSITNRDISQMNIPIWQCIVNQSQKRLGGVHMGTGQEDAHEGLCMFLDCLENINDVKRLFQHRYRTQIFCDNCNEFTVDKREMNLTFEVQPDLKTEQLPQFKDRDLYYNTTMTLNDFIRVQHGYVDEHFKCPKCSATGSKFRKTTLTMVPEILPIVLKKYKEKTHTDFPSKLVMPGNGKNKELIYKLVAQSEHSGSQHGGHYWATCVRKSTSNKLKYYVLNDSSVSEGNIGPTLNTYILFYHIESVV